MLLVLLLPPALWRFAGTMACVRALGRRFLGSHTRTHRHGAVQFSCLPATYHTGTDSAHATLASPITPCRRARLPYYWDVPSARFVILFCHARTYYRSGARVRRYVVGWFCWFPRHAYPTLTARLPVHVLPYGCIYCLQHFFTHCDSFCILCFLL